LVVLYALWVLFTLRGTRADTEVADILLLSAALTAVLTALMGLLLSKEPGYEGAELSWHKWTGAAVALGLFFLWQFRDRLGSRGSSKRINNALRDDGRRGTHPLISDCPPWDTADHRAGRHFGGDITHGQNFVLGPVMPDKIKPMIAMEDAMVYKDLVARSWKRNALAVITAIRQRRAHHGEPEDC